ncbi:MAG: N-6 DNA methylase [Syntrophales bacterium]|nr:N-6 DNA methylase [Syntrophales bacterium]
MKSKIKAKSTKIPSPFGMIAHKTERTAVAILMHWMREIIERKNLDLGLPDVETSGDDRKMPDTVIYESRGSQNILCVLEAKPPYHDVFDEKELKWPAREKATQRKAKYFALTNFKRLIWFSTEKVNALRPEEEQIVEKYALSELENLDDIEQTRYREPIKKGLADFLTRLYSVHSGREPEPKQAIDEFLIFRLQEKIRVLSTYYRRIIDDQCHKNSSFAKSLKNWFVDQGWNFAWQSQDFDKASRQTAYLLVNKILFYNLLQAKRPHELAPLEIPESLLKGAQLQKILQSFFDEVLKIDYETIYTTDFIDTIAFPEAKEVIKEIKELITILKKYDFSRLGYDVIGRIFERLIPQDERHNLGQYFTSPDVVDLILKFCLHHEDDRILDPACGAGTFLVRAYQHKKLMNQRKGHEDILTTLWGNDIAKFPAHLATINLAINDLGVDKNYPNILQEDFFALLVGDEGFDPEKWRKTRARTLGREEREVTFPRWFDAVVGNPPYTRQEEISDISPEDAAYKGNLIEKALYFLNKKIAEIGKRAGIHAYFFVHGTKFLKDGGHFGFIVSNSWLDVDYGKGLQDFFLKNYKIIAIIESKVERWFEEADINTCIIILQKCRDKRERDENLVRFVYLKKSLRNFIPPAQDMWEKQVERLTAIDKLKKTILAHNDFYENEELRIYPKSQKELGEEGFDIEEQKYVGAKWGKYLRAPEIFFKILEKGKGKLVPLKEIAEVRRGFTTGANEFFYLTEEEIKEKGIEKEFWMHQDENGNWVPNYVIKSPRECKSIVVKPEDLKYRVLMVHKDKKDLKGTNILRYIQEGDRKGFDKRPTCASRGRWYDLGIWEKPDLIWSDAYNDRYGIYDTQKTWADKRFFYIYLKNKADYTLFHAYLNSSIIPLMIEIDGITNLGEGAVYTNVYQVERLQIPSSITKELQRRLSSLLRHISDRKILSIFHELGASSPAEVSLSKVKPDRRELDKIIMGEILGLTEEEQLEVYRAVIDLVKSRIEKAKSFGKKKKTKEGIDVDAFVKTVMSNIGEETLGKFYREKILTLKPLLTKILPKASGEIKIERSLFGWRLSSGRQHIECGSEEEARYLRVFLEVGLEKVKVPKDDGHLDNILSELEALKNRIAQVVNSYLESIRDIKTRERLKHLLWVEIVKDTA